MSELHELQHHLNALATKWDRLLAEGITGKTPRQQYDEVHAIRLEFEQHPAFRKFASRRGSGRAGRF